MQTIYQGHLALNKVMSNIQRFFSFNWDAWRWNILGTLSLSLSLSYLRCASKGENRQISLADSDMENKFEQKEKLGCI